MTKQLPRRLFLKALAAAPAVAQKVAEETVGAYVAPVGAAGQMIGAGVPPMIPGSHTKLLELVALNKAGLLPDWVKRQTARSASYMRRIDPDVACLQSVSLSAKIRISADRAMEQEWQNLEQHALDGKLMAEFMGWGHS